MGCCLSTTTSTAPKTNHPHPTLPNNHHRFPESDVDSRAPPPLDEETVKEVLSETPIPKPPIPSPTPNTTTTTITTTKPEVQDLEIESTVEIKPKAEEIVSEVSEASGMYSFTESFSTTLTDKKDDDGEVTQRVFERSPAKVPRKRPYTGELAGTKERPIRPPPRRSAPSPEKRSNVTASRSVQGRTVGMQRRNVGPPNGPRRDSGEVSGRRSRSPVTRVDVGTCRNVRRRSPSPSLGATGRSGNRSPVNNNGGNGGKLEKQNDDVVRGTSESLEDPLVSLECFIFL